MQKRKVLETETSAPLGLFALEDSLTSKHFPTPLWKQFLDIECDLNVELKTLQFPNITYIYNPIEYALDLHCQYLRKFLNGKKKLIIIGMNPGPNGMAQNGIPFGNINTVKNLMKIEGQVQQPSKVHPKRQITGLACTIEEPSGVRIWNLVQKLSGSLEVFSQQCFIHNFCPLVFYNEQGNNITPSEIKGEVKLKLRDICLKHLYRELELIEPDVIIAVGSYVGNCLKTLSKKADNVSFNSKILQLAHPSPRSLNNSNWPEKATEFFETNNLLKYLRNEL